MATAWARCAGHVADLRAPLDQVDAVWIWAAGDHAIGAQAVAALCAPVLDLPVVLGSGAEVPAWVGGAALAVLVDPEGDGAGGGVLEQLGERGSPVVGLTRGRVLAERLVAEGHAVAPMPDEAAVLPPVVVPLLEVLGLADAAGDLASWRVPDGWSQPDALPHRLAVALAATGGAVPAVYGSDGVGAVAAAWLADQLRLFTGRLAVGASFAEALTHLPTWGGSVQPVAWLVARDAEAGVAAALDDAAADVLTVRCTAATDAGRLAELVALAEMAVGGVAR